MARIDGTEVRRCAGAVLVCWLASGCEPAVASPPRLPARDAPEAERVAAYQQYRLQEEGNPWVGWKWKRRDGAYHVDGIEPLLTSSEGRRRIDEIHTRRLVLTPMAAVSGALLGVALGDLITPKPRRLLSTPTRTGLAITGGALLVTGVTITVVWDPITGLGGVYNQDLAQIACAATSPESASR